MLLFGLITIKSKKSGSLKDEGGRLFGEGITTQPLLTNSSKEGGVEGGGGGTGRESQAKYRSDPDRHHYLMFNLWQSFIRAEYRAGRNRQRLLKIT